MGSFMTCAFRHRIQNAMGRLFPPTHMNTTNAICRYETHFGRDKLLVQDIAGRIILERVLKRNCDLDADGSR